MCDLGNVHNINCKFRHNKIFIINPLNTKRRSLYLKTQTVPCCKHFSSRL